MFNIFNKYTIGDTRSLNGRFNVYHQWYARHRTC